MRDHTELPDRLNPYYFYFRCRTRHQRLRIFLTVLLVGIQLLYLWIGRETTLNESNLQVMLFLLITVVFIGLGGTLSCFAGRSEGNSPPTWQHLLDFAPIEPRQAILGLLYSAADAFWPMLLITLPSWFVLVARLRGNLWLTPLLFWIVAPGAALLFIFLFNLGRRPLESAAGILLMLNVFLQIFGSEMHHPENYLPPMATAVGMLLLATTYTGLELVENLRRTPWNRRFFPGCLILLLMLLMAALISRYWVGEKFLPLSLSLFAAAAGISGLSRHAAKLPVCPVQPGWRQRLSGAGSRLLTTLAVIVAAWLILQSLNLHFAAMLVLWEFATALTCLILSRTNTRSGCWMREEKNVQFMFGLLLVAGVVLPLLTITLLPLRMDELAVAVGPPCWLWIILGVITLFISLLREARCRVSVTEGQVA